MAVLGEGLISMEVARTMNDKTGIKSRFVLNVVFVLQISAVIVYEG